VSKFPNRVSGFCCGSFTPYRICTARSVCWLISKNLTRIWQEEKTIWFLCPSLLWSYLCTVLRWSNISGVVLDSRLTCREHVNTKVNKAHSVLQTYDAAWVLRPKVVYWIYVSIIRTSVTFASSVWRAGCQKARANKRLSKIKKNCTLKDIEGNAPYSYGCYGAIHLTSSTWFSGSGGGKISCTTALGSGMLILPSPHSRSQQHTDAAAQVESHFYMGVDVLRHRDWKGSKQLAILFACFLFYSVLFYSILSYSILFYSILFHSILFYSETDIFSTFQLRGICNVPLILWKRQTNCITSHFS
jgi:hypothetical protein